MKHESIDRVDAALEEIVSKRLEADRFLDQSAKHLVLMACEGNLALAAGLDAGTTRSPVPAPGAGAAAVRAFLSSISVEGFRGIGPPSTLTLRPGPGLTLVIGRNGSGKSSFAEALEILLTGDNRRWKGRSAAWREDWRNLHDTHTCIDARFLVEGDRGPATVVRRWADRENDVGASSLEVQRTGRQKGDLTSLGWVAATRTYRPFLSYNELGSMLDEGPSKLYDALSTVLGLEDLVSAQELLRQARLDRRKALKGVKDQLPGLRERLAACDDPRAVACLAALKSKDWDLDRLEAQVISGSAAVMQDAELARLQRVAARQAPPRELVVQAAGELRAAAQGSAAMAVTGSARSLQRAELLERAVQFHHDHGGADCPVCGTAAVLGPSWEAGARDEMALLRAEAQAADSAHSRLERSRRAALALIGPPPQALTGALGLGMDAEVSAAIDQWGLWASSATAGDPEALASLLVERAGPLDAAVSHAASAAAGEIARREDRWRPVATAVAEWVGPAREARAQAEAIPAITAAEDWVRAAATAIRDERFGPIADRATAVWEALSGQSNVALQRISLGAHPQRRVTLDVTVDGVGGAALGVMSQGELHSLALSLFLPRATLAESPFRFIVIDDPVQSMDPARVEGLARVLEEAAKNRQVIVFTHDDRLPEACRRLQVAAEMIAVNRGAGSVVELARVSGPVERYLEDARAIASTKELTEAITTRVAGVFCRLALEAACTETVIRRRLGRGEPHAAVEALVAGAETLGQKAALALFDDRDKTAGEVLTRLSRFGPWAADAYKDANKGSHQALSVPALKNLIDNTQKLAQRLAGQP